ncbi:rhodanese-like domain-containing protein [Devosia sp.]|uniref:rhodanese-like domain-containing protein n=1 Tax=Devosia sp. TaxID=1871048 RepID=UPI001A0B42D8|nr:rhodanese-like domain-containing protein [Devosia sp.]MBE0577939.1 rhodanese-like domain-containing protein [Devosia sp.]
MTATGADAWSRRTFVLALLASVGCGSPLWSVARATAAEEADPAFETIMSDQLAQMLSRKDVVLVNVHIPYEGEIAPTDAFIPFDQIGEYLGVLPADRTASIVLYCKSGRMSEIAANALVDFGYTGVSHLEGGMIEWENAGYAVIHN